MLRELDGSADQGREGHLRPTRQGHGALFLESEDLHHSAFRVDHDQYAALLGILGQHREWCHGQGGWSRRLRLLLTRKHLLRLNHLGTPRGQECDRNPGVPRQNHIGERGA